MKSESNLTDRVYFDNINNVFIHFYSDAKQETIDFLSFNDEWPTVKGILKDWGYAVVEFELN